ncbi:MAG: HupE/UreJ family protein [Verrucomicrobiota bacterium]
MKHSITQHPFIMAIFAIFFVPTLLQAHPTPHEVGFIAGLNHPFTGLDHILAMIAIGLWAAQTGGRALWLIPTAFVSTMILGGSLGIAGIEIPRVEQGILASVLVLGLLITTATQLPLIGSSVLVSLFALCHGFAHGSEIPTNVSGFTYMGGFVLATALLHGLGIGMAFGFRRMLSESTLRWAGAAIVLGGLYLAS